MINLKFPSLLIFILFTYINCNSQCSVSISASSTTLPCGGGTVTLVASGIGNSTAVLNNNFDGGNAGSGWNVSPAGQFNNPCDPSVDGGTYMWMGSGTAAPRTLETAPLDVSCGGNICFYLDMATQGHSSPCEGPDLTNEGVYLEYSTNGGTSWTTIFYFQPQSYTSWAQYCFPIPNAAQTTSTIFKWWQSGSSGSGYDHWGIDNVTIDAVNCNSLWYDWSHVSGTTGPIGDDSTQTVNVISDTTFTVCYTDGQGFSCCESITITVQGMGPPIVNTTDEICIGDNNGQLNISPVYGTPNYTIQITGPSNQTLTGSGAQNFTGLPPGTYNISITDNALCTVTSSATLNPGFTLNTNAGTPFTKTCVTNNNGMVIGTSSNASSTYSWSPSSGISNNSISNPTANPTITTTYTLTETDFQGCVATDQIVVTVNTTNPISNAGTDITIDCNNTNDAFVGTGGGSYSWNTPSGTINNSTINLNSSNLSGTYSLTVTAANGCTDSDNAILTIDTISPISNAGTDITIDCNNTNDAFVGTGGGSYSWNTPSGTINNSTINLNSSNLSGTYSLTVTAANGCTNSDNAILTIDTISPIADAGTNLILNCANTIVTLDGSNSSGTGINFLWTGPSFLSTTNTSTTTTSTDGTYFLTITASNGCTNLDSTNITTNFIYPFANAGLDKIIDCNNPVVIADGSASDSAANIIYLWSTSNGSIIGSLTTDTTSVNLDGEYIITVTNTTNGCNSSDTMYVTQDTISPVIVLDTNTFTIDCNNPSVTFNANSSTGIGNVYLWTTNNGNFVSGDSTTNPVVDLDGSYVLSITSSNGCISNPNQTVTVLMDTISPNINITPSDTLTCNVLNLNLDASGSQNGVTYLWTTNFGIIISGDTTANPLIGDSGIYNLTITASNGCTTSSSIFVNQAIEPNASLFANPTSGTQPLLVNFSDSSSGLGLSFDWDFGNGDFDNSQHPQYTYTDFGDFEVILTVTDIYGCVDYDTITINVWELIEMIIPNIFTPNGDGINDIFIINASGVKELDSKIFNRWGQVIYEWNHDKIGWDGFLSTGQESAEGTYYFIINAKFNDGTEELHKGEFMLKR